MKKQFIVAAALVAALLLLPLSAFAQEEAENGEQEVTAPAQQDTYEFGVTNTESRIFHVDLG
ncbi:MAG: hypothetical protein LC641_02665, partial [Spirochaeta sp.]|nr:hypothetical protein [Spirochaeta sp.]